MQVYRGLDIGTAKPDPQLLSALPHHLIDIADPDSPFDVAQFVSSATACAEEIRSRGRLPLVVGGTGYYFKHLLYGLPEAPPVEPAVRERLRDELAASGLPALRERLRQCDPVSAERTAETDPYRTLRALEVYEQTGRRLSDFGRHTGTVPESATLIELWRNRTELAERISRRVDRMIALGLRDEIAALVADGADCSWPGLRAIGYREFFTQEGALRPERDLPAISEQIKTATRRYAKRQQTFANQFRDRLRLHAEATGTLAAIVQTLVHQLDTV